MKHTMILLLLLSSGSLMAQDQHVSIMLAHHEMRTKPNLTDHEVQLMQPWKKRAGTKAKFAGAFLIAAAAAPLLGYYFTKEHGMDKAFHYSIYSSGVLVASSGALVIMAGSDISNAARTP